MGKEGAFPYHTTFKGACASARVLGLGMRVITPGLYHTPVAE